MEVTVVIPTYNRYTRLLETLRALTEQDYENFKVVVVDDGSTESFYQGDRKFPDELPFPYEVIRQKNAGASAATNRGVKAAPEGLIVLFDNDILPAKDCISRHVAFHRDHPGAVLSGSADTDLQRSTTDVQRYKLHMEEIWRKRRPDTEQLLQVGFDNFIITTANMSVPKKVYLDLGGFDEKLRDGYDVDFGFRALMKNVPLYFDRTIKTIHNDQISLRYYAGRQRAYTESKKKIAALHPELRPKLTGIDEQPSAFKRMVYGILRLKPLVKLMEAGGLKWILPKSLRYKIYGSTIAALSLEP